MQSLNRFKIIGERRLCQGRLCSSNVQTEKDFAVKVSSIFLICKNNSTSVFDFVLRFKLLQFDNFENISTPLDLHMYFT